MNSIRPAHYLYLILLGLPALSVAQSGDIDPEVEFLSARELSFNGRYEQAIQIFDRLLARFPDNADYLLGKGQALLWSGDTGNAIPLLQRGLELAPDYEDIYRALAQAHEKNNEPQQAVAIYRAAQLRFDSPPWSTQGINNSKRNMGTGIGARFFNNTEFLNNHRDNWRDTGIGVTGRFDNGGQASLSLINSSRFDLSDNTVAAEAYLPVNDNNLFFTELRYSGSHKVLPEISAHLQLTHSFRNGWGLIGGYRRVEYSESGINLIDLGIEYYFGNYRVAYTSVLSDSNRAGGAFSHRFQAGYTFDSLSNIQLAVSSGSEVEKPINASSIINTDFTSITLWGETRLNRSWSFIYAAGFTDLTINDSRSSNRKSINLGVRYNF